MGKLQFLVPASIDVRKIVDTQYKVDCCHLILDAITRRSPDHLDIAREAIGDEMFHELITKMIAAGFIEKE